MVRLIIRIKQIYDKFAADEMTVYAAQASFFTIIAAFPFIMLLLTVVQIVPSVSQGELMEFILALVPVGYKSVAFRVISDLSLKSPATMISVTAITALWSSSRGMMSIAKGLNRVQGKVEKRWYIVKRLICAGYTIVFILVCVLSLGLLVFGTTIQNFVLRQFPLIARVTQHIISLRTLLALAFFMFVFAGIYTYVPDRKLSLKSQLPGAMFTTAGWILFSMAFSLPLLGLILAIGIVVDDAIVVVENVDRIMNEEHLSPYEATKKAMSNLSGALIAMSLVLCAVFVPISVCITSYLGSLS